MSDDRAVMLHAMQQLDPAVEVDLLELARKLRWRERKIRCVAQKLAHAGYLTLLEGGRARLTKAGATI